MSEPTQLDYDLAQQANELWGHAINGPHVAVLAAMLGRLAAAKAMQEALEQIATMQDGEQAWWARDIAIRVLSPNQEETP